MVNQGHKLAHFSSLARRKFEQIQLTSHGKAVMFFCAVICLGGVSFIFLKQNEWSWSTIKNAMIWQRLGLAPFQQEVVKTSQPIPLLNITPYPMPLQRYVIREPEGVCDLMISLGFKGEGWRRSRSGWNGWECLAELDVLHEDKIKASAFFSLRGNLKNRIAAIRIKFSLPPEWKGRKAHANQLAEKSLVPLFDYFRWIFPTDLREKIRDLTPFETKMDGVDVSLFEEYDSNQFIHLLITMPKDTLPFVHDNGEVRTVFALPDKKPPKSTKRSRPRSSKRQVIDLSTPLTRDEDGVIIPDEVSYNAGMALEPNLEELEVNEDIVEVEENEEDVTAVENVSEDKINLDETVGQIAPSKEQSAEPPKSLSSTDDEVTTTPLNKDVSDVTDIDSVSQERGGTQSRNALEKTEKVTKTPDGPLSEVQEPIAEMPVSKIKQAKVPLPKVHKGEPKAKSGNVIPVVPRELFAVNPSSSTTSLIPFDRIPQGSALYSSFSQSSDREKKAKPSAQNFKFSLEQLDQTPASLTEFLRRQDLQFDR